MLIFHISKQLVKLIRGIVKNKLKKRVMNASKNL